MFRSLFRLEGDEGLSATWQRKGRYLVWKTEEKEAKLLKTTFAHRSSLK
jgi:hypothetical protein